ncbi:MAG: hypothetical protein ACON42_00225 [Flavobacteriaceae bacterium]
MIKLLNSLKTFKLILKGLSYLAIRENFNSLTQSLTTLLARLNVTINGHKNQTTVKALANRWQKMMPPDYPEKFKITAITEDTAYGEIHIKCPLRNSGDAHACFRLMNYDRTLMKKVGGQLLVLESQSTSGKNYCRVAIRKADRDMADLTAAHQL